MRFRLPASPMVDAVRVERIVGACPTAGITIDGELVGEPSPVPGDVSVTDSGGLTPGSWCYAVRIRIADRDLEPALVQVEVPAPTYFSDYRFDRMHMDFDLSGTAAVNRRHFMDRVIDGLVCRLREKSLGFLK